VREGTGGSIPAGPLAVQTTALLLLIGRMEPQPGKDRPSVKECSEDERRARMTRCLSGDEPEIGLSTVWGNGGHDMRPLRTDVDNREPYGQIK